MLQYEEIGVSGGIDTHKTSLSEECMLCHYWYFKKVGFRFEAHACDKYHDILMTAYDVKHCYIKCKRSWF